MSDAELLERARAGDTAAFGALVDLYRDAVFRAALAALRSRTEAEDAAQDTFVKAFRSLGSYRGESSFKTWLLSIAWRQAIDRRRRLTLRLRRFVSPEPDQTTREPRPDPPSPGPGPEAQLLDAELAGHVKQLLARLPPKLRDPLLLFASGDHTYEGMSALLGVPVGTLKWRVMQARRQLKQRLAALGYADE